MERLMGWRKRRAVVLIETALAIPILLLLSFGVVEYGWMFLKSQEISNAARRGARVAVTPDATSADVQTAIATLMSQAGMGSVGYTVTLAPTNVAAADTGDPVTVTVAVPYAASLRILGLSFLPLPATLQSAVTMAKEGP